MDSKQHVHESFVSSAIIFALTAGFGYGAILVGADSFRIPLGVWWIALAQAHGHVQLFGWAGLFVLGVGLYFLPRLRGTTLALPGLARYSLVCWVIGIALRAISQPLISIAGTPMPRGIFLAALAASGTIELAGAALVATMLIESFRRAGTLGTEAPMRSVVPLLAIASISFAIASILNALLSVNAALSDNPLFPSSLDNVLTHLLIYGFLIPLAFAMAARTLPLFLRLAAPPKQELLPLSIFYVTGLALDLMSRIEQPFDNYHTFGALGALLENSSLIVYVWLLDPIFRRKSPWTTNRIPPPPGYIETRKPTRKNYPDTGEFGRFELPVISAFIWLTIAAIFGIFNAGAALFGTSTALNPDIERHAITVGFITLLVFGMAARLLPGFSGKKRVASAPLVYATFWLGNLAALCRVLPLIAPGLFGAAIAYASSGAVGWAAVLCLGLNMAMTFRIN